MGKKIESRRTQDVKQKIEEYFKECKGELVADNRGKPILDRFGRDIRINPVIPTLSGLCYALDFKNLKEFREAMGNDDGIGHILNRAKTYIDSCYEALLADKKTFDGAKYYLSCQAGWSDEQISQAQGIPVQIYLPSNGMENANYVN